MAEDTLPPPVAEVIASETKPDEESKKPEEDQAPAAAAEDAAVEEAEAATAAVTQSVSFKEESNVVADLEDPEKKALDELKQLIQAALKNKEFTPPPPPAVTDETPTTEEPKTEEPKTEEPKTEEASSVSAPAAEEAATPPPTELTEEKTVIVEETTVPETTPPVEETAAPEEPQEEIFIWGVPLVGDEKSDTVLLKFLRARDFKVKDALTMIKNSVIWRKQFGIDTLVEEDLEIPELEKVVFNHWFDKEGHPVCYNVYGEFQNKDLYAKAFGDEEKREKFLRWRIQYLEKGIRHQLDFTPGAVCSMVQVTDLKNTPGPGKKELRLATKKALTLLQDNYPEFVAKQVFINVPWWYLAYNRVISPFFTQRSKSKFVFAGPAKSAETLFKYIAPEQVPVQYGGLSKESDPDFTTADAVTEFTIKPASKHSIEIPATEGSNLVWELRVLGWEVSYGAEFVPTAEDGYTVIVQKVRKFVLTDEPYVKNSFKIGEPGKIILTIDNATNKKKKLLYRYKEKSSTESV